MGGIGVSIVDRTTIRADPTALVKFQRWVFMTAIATQFRGRKEALYMCDLSASPFRLVGDEVDELRPTRITYRLRQMMIRHHAFDVQIFKGDQAVGIYQLARKLVVKIQATVSDLLMGGSDALRRFLNRVIALMPVDPKLILLLGFEFSTQTALANLQCAFGVAVKLGRFNLFASGQRDKVVQAQVNAHCGIVRSVCWISDFTFALQGDEILAALVFRDGCMIDLPFKWSVNDRLNLANFRQVDKRTSDCYPLRVANRLIVVLAMVGWIAFGHSIFARLLAFRWQRTILAHCKVALKSSVQILERLLKHLAVGFLEPSKCFDALCSDRSLAQS